MLKPSTYHGMDYYYFKEDSKPLPKPVRNSLIDVFSDMFKDLKRVEFRGGAKSDRWFTHLIFSRPISKSDASPLKKMDFKIFPGYKVMEEDRDVYEYVLPLEMGKTYHS
ncbi:MAG: hypothetical protein MPK62_00735 [Alphaproteobacteria bacterium]|nr:hypothetical protein [Alphaproteobacteria bacterium]MDA8029664.1 hypothetical protein [Alphaproteobacteria bacterium]